MQSQCSLKVVLEWRRWVLVGAYELLVLLVSVNNANYSGLCSMLQKSRDRYILSH